MAGVLGILSLSLIGSILLFWEKDNRSKKDKTNKKDNKKLIKNK